MTSVGDGCTPIARSASAKTYPMTKHSGIVNTDVVTIGPAIPQRTAESPRLEPTPRIAPEITRGIGELSPPRAGCAQDGEGVCFGTW